MTEGGGKIVRVRKKEGTRPFGALEKWLLTESAGTEGSGARTSGVKEEESVVSGRT